MKKPALLISVVALTFVFVWGFNASKVSSQTSSNGGNVGQALEISPPVLTLSADPGQTITTKISIRAVVNSRLIVTGQVNDFVAAGEDGTPKVLLDDQEDSPYSLKQWIGPLPGLTLNPREIRDLPVTITVPADAAPGGYYGVVRFTAVPPELESTGVALSASLGSLLFIRVNGDAKESLAVEEFSVSRNGKIGSFFESTPLQFMQRLNNNGNVHVQPVGQVIITDMFGKKVAAVNVNLPPRNILPQSIRKFEQPLDSAVIGNKKLFGRYKAELKLTYGDSKQVVTSTITFWVLPYKLIAAAIVGLVGGFFLFRFLLVRYNRRVIRKAQGLNAPPKEKKKKNKKKKKPSKEADS